MENDPALTSGGKAVSQPRFYCRFKSFTRLAAACCLVLLLTNTATSGAVQTKLREEMSARQVSKIRKHLRTEFGFPLPASAQIQRVAVSANGLVRFICVKMPIPDSKRFKQALVQLRRPETQRFVHEPNHSGSRIGSLPAGEEPGSIGAWQTENKFTGGETMLYIQNVKRIGENELKSLSYLVMFSQESRGLAYFYYYPAKHTP